MKRILLLVVAVGWRAEAQNPLLAFPDAVVALEHVKVIDGTGAAARADQTIVVDHGKIAAIGDAGRTSVPANARVLDLRGDTAYPGLVGMHEHLFYPAPHANFLPVYNELPFSAPRLYLAAGVTTMRTAGSMEPYADLNLKQLIDKGLPGPAIDVTAPYIEGPGGFSFQMPVVHSSDEARRFLITGRRRARLRSRRT
jgi:cytosine/adenosine deaminase-related metal-dependent hydrolase